MGMFNDAVNANRTGWTYRYSGSELFPFAKNLFALFEAKEIEARNRMSDYMKDMKVAQSDSKVSDTKKDIEKYGRLKEECEVYVHEFKRYPEKVYDLGLGDVTFFGLTKPLEDQATSMPG